MAKVRIEFDTDNAAFEDDFNDECFRVLERAYLLITVHHRRAPNEPDDDVLHDTNGNRIGKVEYAP